MKDCTRTFEEPLVEVRDIKKIIIDIRQCSIFQHDTLDRLTAVMKNILDSLHQLRITCDSSTRSSRNSNKKNRGERFVEDYFSIEVIRLCSWSRSVLIFSTSCIFSFSKLFRIDG